MGNEVAVIGAGTWGTTVASMAAAKSKTVIWSRREELAEAIGSLHQNPDYLPGYFLDEGLSATSGIRQAVEGAWLVIMAVPSHGFRGVLDELAPFIEPGATLLSLSKGLEQGTLLRMTELIQKALPGHPYGVLSGPNLANDIVNGHPAATVVSMSDEESGLKVQELLRSDLFRVYTNPDIVGVEVAGALKNVHAIAAGFCDGIGLGDSTRSALITRGLAELGRLVTAMGGDVMTVAGLAGVGDLIATCTSELSRNRTVGLWLGRGRGLDEILAEMRMVAEGVKSARPLVELATSKGVELPIAEAVAGVLDGTIKVEEVVPKLMRRSARPEF